MVILIRSVPQAMIRCDQVGDWDYNPKLENVLYGHNGVIVVSVLDTISPEAQLAVAIHELIEAWQCRKAGITDETVCAFDQQYEAERKEGKHSETDEPGDDPRSPYREQHADATFVERAVCHVLNVNYSTLLQPGPQSGEDHQKTSSLEPPQCQSPESPPQSSPGSAQSSIPSPGYSKS